MKNQKLNLRNCAFAALLWTLPALRVLAIDGLNISVQCPNVMLSWPSATNADTFMIRYRPTLDPNTPWVVLTDYYPASASGLTFFVHSNVVQCPPPSTNSPTKTGGGPLPPGPSLATFSTTTTAATAPSGPLVMLVKGPSDLIPLALYPPGFDLSDYVILDPKTGERLSGAGYVIKALPPEAGGSSGPVGASDPGYYEVVKDGATLYGLSDGEIISGVWGLPFEAAEPGGDLGAITLEDWIDSDTATPISDSLLVPPFPPFITFDTTLLSNGPHNIGLYVESKDTNGNVYEDESAPVTVNVSNEISFPNWMPGFGEMGNTMLINAQSAHSNVTWFLDVYHNETNYIGTMSDTTTNGNIYIVWNLTGPDGTFYPDNTFQFVLSTAYGASTTPSSFLVTDHWNGPGDWVVVNQQAWNTYVGHEDLDTEADGVAQAVQALGLTTRPSAGPNTSYKIRFDPDPNAVYDWANFRTGLYNNLSRNLFYLGHGDAGALGYSPGAALSISAKEIAKILLTMPVGQTNAHKFRFVCLDGCSTAKGNLCAAFGIIPKVGLTTQYYVDAGLRPSTFVGWDKNAALGVAGLMDINHFNVFNWMFYYWSTGYKIQAAKDKAALEYSDDLVPAKKHLVVFGDGELAPNAYNR